MVPHILFHNTRTNYYPNYTAWNCGNKIHSSGITQPPILATILKEILNKNNANKTQLLNIKKIILKLKNFMNGSFNLEIQKKLAWYQFCILGRVDMIIPLYGMSL